MSHDGPGGPGPHRRTLLVTPIDEDPAPGAPPVEGRVLEGKYRLGRRLGAGGMGSVHEAVHLGTGRRVAVKLIAPQFMREARFLARFRREARAAGRLRHPNIVDVTDFGVAPSEDGDVAYLVMEYLEGLPLGRVMARGSRMPLGQAIDILRQVCAAVHAAHRRGVVHRDLKPDNIWLEPNSLGGHRAKVLDFGIAKLGDAADGDGPGDGEGEGDGNRPPAGAGNGESVAAPGNAQRDAPAHLTHAGAVLGTPWYMSPEQCRGLALDGRSDIYSLGVIAYQMLCGDLPFTGDAASVMAGHRDTPPEDLRRRCRKVPSGVARVVMAALSKDPACRPATAMAFADGLEANAQGFGFLFRRATAFYVEHFPLLLRMSLVAHLPLLALGLAAAGVAWARPALGDGAHATLAAGIGGLKGIVGVFSGMTLGGWAAVLVVQQELEPFRVPTLAGTWGVLRSRWRAFLRTALLSYVRVIVGFACLIVPGFVLWARDALWAPIVLVEGLGGRAALRRSRDLGRRGRWAIAAAVGLQVFLPKLFESMTGLGRMAEGVGDERVRVTLAEGAVAASVVILPLVVLVPAFLYLKMRRLGGEPIQGLPGGTAAPGDEAFDTDKTPA
ncbi:MAG: serine/threonine-protein kinase [Verrucomicrobiota bacterium]